MSRPDCAGRVPIGAGPRARPVCCGFRDHGGGAPCYLRAEPFPPLPLVDLNRPHPFYERAARFFDTIAAALREGATVDQAIAAARRETARDVAACEAARD